MDVREILIVAITLIVAATFFFLWRRRDAGIRVQDRLPDALHEPLDGQSKGSWVS